MNFKSTLLLLILAGGAGLWLWKGDDWGPKIGLTSRSQAPAESKSLAALTENFTSDKITRIEITGDSSSALTLEKGEGEAGWKLPGNWPLRQQEVADLVALFADLRTRFQAISIAENEDLTRYGLGPASKPIVVKVTAAGAQYALAFGEPKLADGESPFTRSCYLRVNDNSELLRLGPDVMPVLRRPPDSYRRRQLFPESERIKLAQATPFGGGTSTTVSLLTDKVKEIDVKFAGRGLTIFGATIPRSESYVLKRVKPFPQAVAADKGAEPTVQPQRIADAWEIAAPQRDRIDADKLEKILTTIPDLWVEEFAPDAAKAGLDKPDRAITVTKADGSKLALLIGNIARTVERDETVTAPSPMPGLPPMPMTRKVFDEYRYAKLTDNPQVFVVRADKFNDIFVKADTLRDSQLAHFTAEEVQDVSIESPGKPLRKLIRKDDKWMIDAKPEPLTAEPSQVSDLLNRLSSLQASETAPPESKPTPGTAITLSLKEKPAIVFHFGQPKFGPWPAVASASSALVAVAVGANTEGQSIPASVEGWPRVASIDSAILKAVNPEGSFRDRTLTNFIGSDKLILEKDGKVVTFSKTGMQWKQTAPKEALVDPGDLDDFVTAIGHLRAEKFVAENATPVDFKKYGLDTPKAKWTALANGKDQLVLLVGNKEPDGKAYAKLAAGNAVVLLSADTTTKVLADYRGRKLWDLEENKVQAIEVEREGKKFKFVRKGTGWEDPDAPKDTIDDRAVDGLLTALVNLRVERWVGDKPEDIKKAGLEKPASTITLSLKDNMKRTLHLGGSVDEPLAKKVYGKTGDAGAEVFILGEPDAARLLRERSAYVEKK